MSDVLIKPPKPRKKKKTSSGFSKPGTPYVNRALVHDIVAPPGEGKKVKLFLQQFLCMSVKSARYRIIDAAVITCIGGILLGASFGLKPVGSLILGVAIAIFVAIRSKKSDSFANSNA